MSLSEITERTRRCLKIQEKRILRSRLIPPRNKLTRTQQTRRWTSAELIPTSELSSTHTRLRESSGRGKWRKLKPEPPTKLKSKERK